MKIVIKESKGVKFGSLKEGQTFIDPEYEDGATILMVVMPALDVDITTDIAIADAEYAGYAVDLSSGMVLGYGSAEEVIPVDTTLTAEKI